MQSWKEIIEHQKSQEYFQKLKNTIEHQYQATPIYPPREKIFAAFDKTPLETLKVVILGQDPYHAEGQAQGLAFSTPANIPNPPSMVNILKEIESDLGAVSMCQDGGLTPWANQGVLLLNTILTVKAHQPKSHRNIGWEIFTDNIITHISNHCENSIFLLWGSNAIAKSQLIDKHRHSILTAPHPSPLSAYRGFLGCRHFGQTNALLKRLGKTPIVW